MEFNLDPRRKGSFKNLGIRFSGGAGTVAPGPERQKDEKNKSPQLMYSSAQYGKNAILPVPESSIGLGPLAIKYNRTVSNPSEESVTKLIEELEKEIDYYNNLKSEINFKEKDSESNCSNIEKTISSLEKGKADLIAYWEARKPKK